MVVVVKIKNDIYCYFKVIVVTLDSYVTIIIKGIVYTISTNVSHTGNSQIP